MAATVSMSGYTTPPQLPIMTPPRRQRPRRFTVMFDEHALIYSPLNQTLHLEGHRLEIHIYRMPNTGWTLEVVGDA